MTKLSRTTIKLLRELDREEKVVVDKIIKRHLKACFESGTPTDAIDRVVIEAVEAVELAISKGGKAEDALTEMDSLGEVEGPKCEYSVYKAPEKPEGGKGDFF